MKLQQPFKNYFRVSQYFGQNYVDFYRKDGLLGHTGIDWAMPDGVPIIAPCNGTVIYVSRNPQQGEGVTVLSDNIFQWEEQDCRMSCVHWHLKDQSIVVNVGDEVKTGDLLGLSNNTGRSTGPHLHLSVCPISIDGKWRELAGDNGYGRCIDPLPYLNIVASPIAPPRTLKIGMRGEDVVDLQEKLGIRADGIFGPKTQKAVIQFQIKHQLKPDGIVGRLTNVVLNL